jgi:hypothetical protein
MADKELLGRADVLVCAPLQTTVGRFGFIRRQNSTVFGSDGGKFGMISFARPGLKCFVGCCPAMNRWAIFDRPGGTAEKQHECGFADGKWQMVEDGNNGNNVSGRRW